MKTLKAAKEVAAEVVKDLVKLNLPVTATAIVAEAVQLTLLPNSDAQIVTGLLIVVGLGASALSKILERKKEATK